MFGVGTAEDESGDELVEDDPIGNSSPVASEGVVVVDRGQKSFELAPERVDD
ncbi:hypothetical protein BKA07_003074 [Brevibacterium marinum]|uniref:Uncharacterized protein n=1 Tax=Brevibacterium marinum TaxID=418643 RepID=A0A846RZA4_9MICO|nr:hypothetical protein [Brevibacterium marinum]NJC57266.1 hypothetical protein [Brevibacterium marinum]NJC58039.1 hypothetical protein [Brevibacterium marinum]